MQSGEFATPYSVDSGTSAISAMRVIIIDDHELVREGLVSLITHYFPDHITVIFSGENLESLGGLVCDVVLLDVDLGPGSNPVEANVADLVAANHNVLLISSSEDSIGIRHGLNAGALGFIPKRVGTEVLFSALETVAAGEMFLSVDLASILANAPDRPELSPRETDALRLYAAGLTLVAVAHRMEISPHTAKEYLDRVRRKYELIGRSARTRTELYVVALDDGILYSE
jgi:DNA-binding NarL/FixJ family response regulator